MLLSDPSIKALLQDDLVPSWESVHETAKVTIDFADGKSLKRTIGGNTVIYICRADGAVLDAFPGVHTKDDFLIEAKSALDALASGHTSTTDARFLRMHSDAVKWLQVGGVHAIGKSAMESPVLLRANIRGANAPLHDLSKDPRNARGPRYLESPKAIFGKQTPEEFGQVLVKSDSMNNRYIVRPHVRAMLGRHKTLPTPSECTELIYKGILGTDLADPYLGMLDAKIPGTLGLTNR
ncbi:MAG: hypothetical protein ACI89X_002396 [Planctomycetota bacterium]